MSGRTSPNVPAGASQCPERRQVPKERLRSTLAESEYDKESLDREIGLDPKSEIHDPTGRPYRLAEGEPLRALFA